MAAHPSNNLGLLYICTCTNTIFKISYFQTKTVLASVHCVRINFKIKLTVQLSISVDCRNVIYIHSTVHLHVMADN